MCPRVEPWSSINAGNNQELNLKAHLYIREIVGVVARVVVAVQAEENTAMIAGGIAPIDCLWL